MKAILLGPNGQLGTDIRSANNSRQVLNITPMGRDQLELTDFEAVKTKLSNMQFDVLINASSYHKTDEVEDNAQQAITINAHLVQLLAQICAEKGARFVHISTDYVFGGQAARQPLDENTGVAPLNVYGASKVLGESLARVAHDDTLILRVASLFGVAGASGKGGNFVETMLRLAKERGSLRVVNDQIMSPTSTADIADALLDMLETPAPAGTYHVVNRGEVSWHGFASEIVKQAGLEVPVDPVPTTEFPTRAMRPPYSALDNRKLEGAIGRPMPTWQDALARYMRAKGHTQRVLEAAD